VNKANVLGGELGDLWNNMVNAEELIQHSPNFAKRCFSNLLVGGTYECRPVVPKLYVVIVNMCALVV